MPEPEDPPRRGAGGVNEEFKNHRRRNDERKWVEERLQVFYKYAAIRAGLPKRATR